MMISSRRSSRDTRDPRMQQCIKDGRRIMRGVRRVGAKAVKEVVVSGRPELGVVAYGCGRCGQVYDLNYVIGTLAARHAHVRSMAEKCCENRCIACLSPVKRFHQNCDACSERRRAEDRRKWAVKAEPCKLDDTEWVFCEGRGYNEGYFSSMDDLVEFCCDEGLPLPTYVHPCTEVCVKVDAESIYVQIDEDVGLEESASENLDGCEEFEAAIDAFNKKNAGPLAWQADFSRVIIIDAKAFNDEFGNDQQGRPTTSWNDRPPTVDPIAVAAYRASIEAALAAA